MNISIIAGIIVLIEYVITTVFINDRLKRNKIFLFLSFMSFFIILYLRKPFSDLNDYIDVFKYFKGDFANFSITRYELLYKLLNIVIGKIWLNERFFMFVVDIITLAGPYYIIRRYSKNYLFSVLLFVAIGTYGMQFYVIRQALAISILLYSVKYIETKQLFKFVISIIIAGLLHSSAFIFIIAYLLPMIKVNKKNFIVWVFILLIIYFFRRHIVLLLLGSTEYSSYIGGQYDVAGEGQWKLLLYIFLFIYCLLFKRNYDNDDSSSLLLSISLLCICFQLVATSSTSFVRIANYFCFPFYLLPINVTECQKNNHTRFLINMLFIIFYFLFVYLRNPINGYSLFF